MSRKLRPQTLEKLRPTRCTEISDPEKVKPTRCIENSDLRKTQTHWAYRKLRTSCYIIFAISWHSAGQLYIFSIHQTHYEKSDWSRAFNQFTIACELDMINVISAAGITFIMSSSSSAWLLSPLECSQKQNG